MLLVFPVAWIHYYLFLAVPLVLLPFWWRQQGLPENPGLWVAFAVAVWMVSGVETRDNAHYAALQGSLWSAWLLAAQPLGALLLIVLCALPMPALVRRADS